MYHLPRETHGPGQAATNTDAEYLPSHKVSKANVRVSSLRPTLAIYPSSGWMHSLISQHCSPVAHVELRGARLQMIPAGKSIKLTAALVKQILSRLT
jgi:hypothetical protein